MKQYFLLSILALIAAAVVGWFGWMVIRALHTVLSDWRLGRELDELEAECAARRRARTAERLHASKGRADGNATMADELARSRSL